LELGGNEPKFLKLKDSKAELWARIKEKERLFKLKESPEGVNGSETYCGKQERLERMLRRSYLKTASSSMNLFQQ
jgi:hypothetical protein